MQPNYLPPHRHGPEAPPCDVTTTAGTPTDGRPHVAVVGAGFGGLAAVKRLSRAPVRVTLIDKRNHHLFQPLLFQVATAGLSPAEIATPIRSIFRDCENVTVLLEEVLGVNPKHQEVVLAARRVAYDYLVIAAGAQHSYFGHDDWQDIAPGLKSLEDAMLIRRRILMAFERAEIECDARPSAFDFRHCRRGADRR